MAAVRFEAAAGGFWNWGGSESLPKLTQTLPALVQPHSQGLVKLGRGSVAECMDWLIVWC